MEQEAGIEGERKTIKFSIRRNLLYQFVYFPLLFTLITLIPLAFFFFINLFIRNNMLYGMILGVGSALLAFLAGYVLAAGVRAVEPKTAALNRYITLAAPALTSLAVLIAYLAGGIIPAKIAAFAANPLLLVSNFLCNFILEYGVILTAILSSVSYTAGFLIFTRKAFHTDGKRNVRKFALITALVGTFAFSVGTYAVYPEAEYDVLKIKYDSLTFQEEMDYKFYDNLPFDEQNNLIETDEIPNLDFADVNLTPRLDGATAFYPVYAAVAQSCYSGLQAEIEKNELSYYARYRGPMEDGDNIRLELTNEQADDPVLKKCAELIRCTQTHRAYDNLVDGKTDVVFAFEPSEEQIAYAAQKGVEFELTPIGYDAFCFFVSTQNPVDRLTVKQIQDIYSGNINNWKKVGGKNKRIFAFTRPKNSGSQTVMENLVMKDVAIRTKFEPKEVRTMGGIIHIVDGYLNTPAAIGYTFRYYSSFMVQGDAIKYIAVDGVAPTSETVRSGAYAFRAPFYAVTAKGRETDQTRSLLNWLQSEQGQRLIEEVGYVGL